MSDNDTLTDQETRFATKVAQALDQPLDENTLARLQAAREAAVEAAVASSSTTLRPWLAGGSVGGALAAGVALVFLLQTPSIDPLPVLSDSELAAAVELELLESLDMLVWLDEEMLATEETDAS